MSLINEALRKARKEAVADPGGSLGVAGPAESIRRGPEFPARLILMGVGAAVAAALGAGITWWIVRPKELSGRPPESVMAAVAEVATPAPVVAEFGDTELATAPGSPLEALDSGGGEAGTVAERPEVAPTVPPSPSPKPVPPAPDAIGPEGELIYHVVAKLNDVTLSLGYLISRPVDPFAEINGREVRVGTEVDGYRVTAIERSAIRLIGPRGTIILQAN